MEFIRENVNNRLYNRQTNVIIVVVGKTLEMLKLIRIGFYSFFFRFFWRPSEADKLDPFFCFSFDEQQERLLRRIFWTKSRRQKTGPRFR